MPYLPYLKTRLPCRSRVYYNDAGVQINNLACRASAGRGYKPGEANWPESAYNGDYIAEIAADFSQETRCCRRL